MEEAPPRPLTLFGLPLGSSLVSGSGVTICKALNLLTSAVASTTLYPDRKIGEVAMRVFFVDESPLSSSIAY